jgi:anthranilate phosphoribosyltransferase
MSIQEAIAKVIDCQDLTEAEAESAMTQIMQGQATPAQIGAFLTALRMKGEAVSEITGCARAMRRSALPVRPHRKETLVDTCGTGGDGAGTFNISTTAAFVVAGAGQPVAKHGNRSISSQSGSADVLEALGVKLDLTPDQVAACVDEIGIGFLFAPKLHPAMKYAIGPRRELGIRTIFNLLGPLTNPANAPAQVLGVYDPALTETLARVLGALGSEAAFVVHGAGGLDELTTTGPNRVSALRDGCVETCTLDPADLGFSRARPADLRGGDAQENATITREILSGRLDGARHDVVVLNAAAALVASGRAHTLPQGIRLAKHSLDSGAAQRVLDNLIEFTRTVGELGNQDTGLRGSGTQDTGLRGSGTQDSGLRESGTQAIGQPGNQRTKAIPDSPIPDSPSPESLLARIVDYKRTEELPRRMRDVPLETMQARAAAAPAPCDFIAGLRSAPGVALIAEVKRASPSKGVLRPDFDPVQLAATYAANGAAAISVLTDEPFFQGSLAYLAQIRQRLALPLEGGEQPRPLPLLRKDFIIHPYQVYEARAAGADALLLIAAILPEADLAQLLSLTHTLGMTALVEVTSEEELGRVLPLAPQLVGVNNRDLRDFSVNLNTCLRLRPLVPPDICLVAESGIHTRADVARLAAAGVDAVLVGEALVTAPNVAAKIRELTDGHGREEIASGR